MSSLQHIATPTRLSTTVAAAQAIAGNKGAFLADHRSSPVVQRKLWSNGGAMPVQRKTNSTGLPDQLKSGIENLSGFSMDDVKVHYNSSAPAQLQAHAYAQGTNIHLAPGQEKHLPHEAWHVVQQKQGRVKPTMQLKSKVNVNDDVSLEKEADMMGAKAVQRYSYGREILLQKKSIDGVVQRKVGFEFESTGSKEWRFQGKQKKRENWTGINHTKAILYETPNKLAGVSADNGKVEFVTKALSTWAEVKATIEEMVAMAASLKTGTGPKGITELQGAENDFAKVNTGMKYNRINSKNSIIIAKPQATIGVAMVNIGELFTTLVNMGTEKEDEHSKKRKRGMQKMTMEKVVASRTVVQDLGVSLARAQEMMKNAVIANGANWDILPEQEKKETTGLLAAILKTISDAEVNSGRDLDDAKYAFPLMPRTDFHSMFASMTPNAQLMMKTLWDNSKLVDEIRAEVPLDVAMFPGKYTAADGNRYEGPKRNDWIESVINGGGKDLMSPPPGYAPHPPVGGEGLGAYNTDGTLALFELRDLEGMGMLPPEQWLPLATAICTLVAKFEVDDRLKPV